MAMQNNLTAKTLRKNLDYYPEAGVFVWRISSGNARKGTLAGHTHHKTGYHFIMVEQRLYRAARLAWLWVTGKWPDREVDHINRVRGDNRWTNLRLAYHGENTANTPVRADNKSGFKGVSFCTYTKRWRAVVQWKEKVYFLGRFDTPELASVARQKAALELHGEFAS